MGCINGRRLSISLIDASCRRWVFGRYRCVQMELQYVQRVAGRQGAHKVVLALPPGVPFERLIYGFQDKKTKVVFASQFPDSLLWQKRNVTRTESPEKDVRIHIFHLRAPTNIYSLKWTRV